MYAKVESLGLNGLDAFSDTVEADISTEITVVVVVITPVSLFVASFIAKKRPLPPVCRERALSTR